MTYWRRLCLFWVACGLGLSAACGRARPAPPPPLVAQVSGTLAIAGLAAPVRIVRDAWGVPHIYAKNDADLFFAQGLVQAQDRLFQMDLWRRSAQGRLSEVLGPNFIERDAMTRRIQYSGDTDADWASYGADAKSIAGAFIRGVNAWVALARERPPEEFALAGWKPEPWSADDLVNRTEAFTASGDALDEIFRARLLATVGLARATVLLSGDRALDVSPAIDVAAVPDLVADMIRRVGTPPFFLGLSAPVIDGTVRLKRDATDRLTATPTGAPTVAPSGSGRVRLEPDHDLSRTLEHPSLRYFVHLNAPGWNVIGATAPWRPGVAIGHNDRVAWTAEAFDADSQDVYVEKLNPANPRQVEDNGRWVDIDVRQGAVAVRGRKTPVQFTTETTRHGVVVASDLARHLAFAVRWSGTEPGAAAELAALGLDRAESATAFRAALANWKMPARRMTYVDVGGVRGSAIAALLPARRGWNGTVPVPGWTGATEWAGWMAATRAAPATSGAAQQTLAANVILESVRLHPDRADALLQRLAAASSSPDSLAVQRAAMTDALADALRGRALPVNAPVVFTHPLAVTDAARRRFNVIARAPAGAVDAFAVTYSPADWDRSFAIAAPGQSGSPDSPNFADLATLFSEGKSFPLAFSDSAVQAHAAATLTLTPK